MPLSPSVNYLAENGDITKDMISAYYKGDNKAYQKINNRVLDYAKSEYNRINVDVDLFVAEYS